MGFIDSGARDYENKEVIDLHKVQYMLIKGKDNQKEDIVTKDTDWKGMDKVIQDFVEQVYKPAETEYNRCPAKDSKKKEYERAMIAA